MAFKISRRILLAASAVMFFLCPLDTTSAYFYSQRWFRTATDGPGLVQGDPTTITWSIVPDNTTIPMVGASDLIAAFDVAFSEANAGSPDLTNRVWWQKIDASFQRWSDVSGNTYVYEVNDDGVNHGTSVGVLGVRGDVRIGGDFLDGPSGVLAFNFFPNNGDMVIDTSDGGFFSNPAGDYRPFRNTVMHEHGHGFGLNHVESNTANFLMEPFISTSFDGPQLDDIRGIHFGYGDQYEKNGGNDAADSATDMGSFGNGDSFVIGIGGASAFVPRLATDFVSIDDNSDTDFFSVDLDGNSNVTIDLRPQGTLYNQGPQGGNQTLLDSSTVSDLTLALIDTDQTTVLDTSNSGGLGDPEQIADFSLDAGEYFIRVTGNANDIQMYRLEMNVVSSAIDGDFNDDGFWDCLDIDALTAVTAAGSNEPEFDLDGNGTVDFQDVEAWLTEGGANNPDQTSGNAFLVGDANLDGVVDGPDFLDWNEHKFTNSTAWCGGNFNGDAFTDGLDFLDWNDNKFQSSDSGTVAVPEPASICMLLGILAGLGLLRRR